MKVYKITTHGISPYDEMTMLVVANSYAGAEETYKKNRICPKDILRIEVIGENLIGIQEDEK